MGGGGGGGPFVNRSPEDFAKAIRKSEENLDIKQFETTLSGLLSDVLIDANSRDTEAVSERLNSVKVALGDELDSAIDSLYGGSVAKHTYVDGLSDVDSLLILNGTELDGASPKEAVSRVKKAIEGSIEADAKVTAGKIAVTITYSDGMEVQVLPAFKTDAGLKVPSFKHEGWSRIVPDRFQNALTKQNELCNGKLVPTIKLAKAVLSNLPESQQLSGYHVESIAIKAFKNYDGPKTTAAMLPQFFERAKSLVQSPIRDSTGQSIHVDSYLGQAGSTRRVVVGHVMDRIAKRMRNASAHQSDAQWRSILGVDGV